MQTILPITGIVCGIALSVAWTAFLSSEMSSAIQLFFGTWPPWERAMSSPIDPLVIAAAMLLVLCASLVWRQQRRLAAMQTQLGSLASDIRRLEVAHEGLFVRFMNLPRPRSRKLSKPSADALPETSSPSEHPDKKDSNGSMLYAVAPKTSPE